MNNHTKRISEGAMMIALVGVMLFVNRQLANMIEFFMYWILTFPILIYTAKYGIKYGITTSICMLLISFMISSPTTIFYLFCCVVVGLAYGEGIRRKWKNGWLLILSGSITLISYVLTTIVFAQIFGYDSSGDIEIVQIFMNLFHMDVGSISISFMLPMFVLLMAIIMSVLQTICIHMMSFVLLQRLKIEVRPMKTLFDIQVSKLWGILIIIIWILFLGRNVLKLNQEVSTVIFTLYICCYVFSIGYGAITCMIKVILIRKRPFIFLIMLGTLIPYIQTGIALIGIYDMVFSLRKKMERGVLYG